MRRSSGKHLATALIVLLGLGSAIAASFRGRERLPLPTPAASAIDAGLLRVTAPAFSAPAGSACPLTRDQERTAMEAFEKLLPVVRHPRCLNCHGGVNPYVPKSQGNHLGGEIPRVFRSDGSPKHCSECHSEMRMLFRSGRVVEGEGWDVPPEPFFFIGKDASELCMQFKKLEPTGQRFVGHVVNENGLGGQFTEVAYRGDRALNDMAKDDYTEETGRPFVNEPPPGSHEQLIADAQAWVAAMGDGWTVMPDCGCRPFGSAWVGTVTTRFEITTPELGTLTETAKATVRFVIDSSFDISDDPAEYWKSISGTIEWETSNVGGQCRVGASGSVPIGLGADLNPMAMLRGERGDQQGMKFSVGLGPWPDAYQPLFTWRCPENTVQATLHGVTLWWYYDIPAGLESPDGKTLKGHYQGALGSGSMYSEWDLHLVP